MNPELLSAKSLARWFGVSLRTIQRWRADDSFPEPVNGYWSRTAVTLWFAELHAAMSIAEHGPESSSALHMRSAVRRALRPPPMPQLTSAKAPPKARPGATSRGQSTGKTRPT